MAKEIIKADHWRGLDFYQPKNDTLSHVCIVGCGSIGSYVAFGLARIGVKKLTLIDFDEVEPHNLPNQFFAESLKIAEGTLKTNVLASTLALMVPSIEIVQYPYKWEEVIEMLEFIRTIGSMSAIVTTVDKMEVRRNIFENDYVQNYIPLLLDARVGGLFANVFSIPMLQSKAVNYYEKTLHTDAEASELPCTGQAIADVSMCVAGEVVGRYRNFIRNKITVLHTFHDYSIGQAWVQEIIPNEEQKIPSSAQILHTDAETDKVGTNG